MNRYKKFLVPLTVLIVLGVGAYLRLYKISQYMTFLGDEGRDVLIVKRMIVDHKFTLLGPTASVGGFFLGPIYYYFMLPFLWVWRLDPTGPAVMVALLGIATIYLVYRVGKEWFHDWVGIIAASLYALSPIVIAYSRSSWNPNVVPFFSVLLVYLLWRSVAYGQKNLLFWVGLILGIGIQLHYLFLFLYFVVACWYLLYGRSKKFIKYYGFLMTGFLLGYAPFLAFEVRHGFPNSQSVIRFILAGKDTGFVFSQFWKNISDVSYRMVGRFVFRSPQPEIWGGISPWKITTWIWSARLVLFGLLIFFYVSSKRNRQKTADQRQWQGTVLLFLWFSIVVLLFGFYRRAIYDYYFGIVFPVSFLMFAIVIWQGMRLSYLRWIALTIWIFLLFLNWQGRPFLYPPNNQYTQAKRIAEEALSKTNGKSYNFALITDQNSDHVYRYFFEVWGHPPVTIESVQNDPERKTVTDQLIVICETYTCKPLGHPLWEVAGFGRAIITGEWKVPFVTIMRLEHWKGEE